jgi:hypothetical protein
VVVVSLAGQKKPSGLVREKEGALVVAEAEIEAEDASAKVLVASRQMDKARIAVLVVIVPPPPSGYHESMTIHVKLMPSLEECRAANASPQGRCNLMNTVSMVAQFEDCRLLPVGVESHRKLRHVTVPSQAALAQIVQIYVRRFKEASETRGYRPRKPNINPAHWQGRDHPDPGAAGEGGKEGPRCSRAPTIRR